MKYSKKRIQKIQKKSQQKNRKNRRNTKNVRNRRLNNKSIKYGGMESAPHSSMDSVEHSGMDSVEHSAEQSPFPLGTTLSKELALPTDENTICIDIQGITATPKNNELQYENWGLQSLGLQYSDLGLHFFRYIAPKKIVSQVLELNKTTVYIIWQGDKNFDSSIQDKYKCYIPTGIGDTISRVHQLLYGHGINVKIICLSEKDKCKKCITNLSLAGDSEIIDFSKYGELQFYKDIPKNEWRTELVKYYGNAITEWKNYTKDSRLENLIKQYISNLLSNKTFILDYGQQDSISSYFNLEKKEAGNVIHISPE